MSVRRRITRLSRLLDRELKEFLAGHGLERWEFIAAPGTVALLVVAIGRCLDGPTG